MKLLLFLGSGISYPSGLPSVEGITDSLLHDEWSQHTDERFYPGIAGLGRLNDPTDALQELLNFLLPFANRSQTLAGGKGNYEDLYYLCDQIVSFDQGWNENPAIEPFVMQLKQQANHSTEKHRCSLGELASTACDFIRMVVYHKLTHSGKVLGLDLLGQLANGAEVKMLDIVTLNHDTLVEQFLAQEQIHFADGFHPPDGDVRYFNPSTFETGGRIRHFKLHGSINWYRYRGDQDNPFSDRYAICLRGNPDYSKDSHGNALDNVDSVPWILAGTLNKAGQYGYGIYAEMHYWFHKLLHEHDTIAMSGYGFEDRGINARLMDWLHKPRCNRLVLMHEKVEDIVSFSKSSLWFQYEPLLRAGRIVTIAKWLQNVSIEELLRHMKSD